MSSSETSANPTSAPISRRSVAAGLWAAPVLAVTVAVPALAASMTPELTVAGTGTGTSRRWSVTFTNMPANTQISVVASGTQQQTVQWVAGGSGAPSTTAATKTLIVTVGGTGAFTFRGNNAPTGTVSVPASPCRSAEWNWSAT